MHLNYFIFFCHFLFSFGTYYTKIVFAERVSSVVYSLSSVLSARIQYASLIIQAFWCAVNKILEARTITCVPAMAPACGLYLADVKYDFTSENLDEQNVDEVSE